MMYKYHNKTVEYAINKINCGHETIFQVLKNQCTIDLTSSELYFLSNPNDVTIIDNTITLGYNDLDNVTKNININANTNILRVIVTNKNIDKQKIRNEIENGSLVILYVYESMLFYQNYRETRYPYHMVIADGFDQENNLINIIDTFELDDYGNNIKEHEIDFDFALNHIKEYSIVRHEKNRIVSVINKTNLLSIIEQISENEIDGLLTKINQLFELYESIPTFQRIDSIASLKWIILNSYYSNLAIYLENQDLNEYIAIVEETKEKWHKLQLKYIKCCYKNTEGNFVNILGIDELISESRRVNRFIHKIIVNNSRQE